MAFYKAPWFKYAKNFVIGVGAAVVMIGALGKIENQPWGDVAIRAGLLTEAFLFFILGILPPEKDYYWEKLYPGLDKYNSGVTPLTSGGQVSTGVSVTPLDGDRVEQQLGGMLDELRGMSKSLGALKSLQEVDFSQTSDQIKSMNNFYNELNTAMESLSGTVDDAKKYKENLGNLNQNLSSLNHVYGNMLSAMNVNRNS